MTRCASHIESLTTEQGVPRDPRFLMAESFQPPRTIRLMAKFSF